MLIPFPIAFLVGALVTDIVFWASADLFWARASLWLIGAGVVTGALAGIAGSIDFFGTGQVRRQREGWIHFGGNVVVLVIALASLLLRMDQGAAAVLPVGFLLSVVTVALLVITGWYGGTLVYKLRVGVTAPASSSVERAA